MRRGTSGNRREAGWADSAALLSPTDGADSLTRFEAPGQPARVTRPMYVLSTGGLSGAVRSVYAWSPRVDDVRFEGEKIEVTLGAEKHVHWQDAEYWQMELTVGGAHSGIELTGWAPGHEPGSVAISRTKRSLPRRERKVRAKTD